MTEIIEYGLSVSLEASPRTPTTPRGSDNDDEVCYAPPRKPSFSRLMATADDVEEGEEDMEPTTTITTTTTTTTREVSISPRVLFTANANRNGSGAVIRRNLSADFFNNDTTTSLLSPVSFGTSSSVRRVASADSSESIGECGVCYSHLPLHSNHVFTLCGHLFCLRCLLKWWDNATTCPNCRAELLEQDPEAEEAEEAGLDLTLTLTLT
jgi:hypothetical protein